MEGNRSWADKAPVLCVAFARRNFSQNGNPNAWATHDTGMASMALALQAQALGLVVHFMGGFDADGAPAALGLDPDEYQAISAFAIGHQGPVEALPEELQQREAPSTRKPLAEVAMPVR